MTSELQVSNSVPNQKSSENLFPEVAVDICDRDFQMWRQMAIERMERERGPVSMWYKTVAQIYVLFTSAGRKIEGLGVMNGRRDRSRLKDVPRRSGISFATAKHTNAQCKEGDET